MPTPKDLRDAAKEHATFSERMEKNLRKIAEIRDTAGLGSEGSPKGTDALDDETKLVYMEAIREHLCYKMSTAGLRIRDKRLDETDEEYQNDKNLLTRIV